MTSLQEPADASMTRAARRLLRERFIVQVGKGTVELRTDGVIHVLWKPRGTIEAADALAAMVAVNEVCGESERPMLVDLALMDGFSRDARSMFSTPCAASRIALLGSGPVDRVIASFFLSVRPPCPGRFFTSRNEAMGWLAQTDLRTDGRDEDMGTS